MKKILIIAALFTSTVAAAQCDLKTTTTDSTTVNTGTVKWLGCDGSGSCSSIELQEYNTKDPFYMLQLTHAITGAQVIVCSTTDALVIKFSDGDSLRLYTDKVYAGKVNTDVTVGNGTVYVGMYMVSKQQLEKIASKKIVSLSLNHQKGSIDMKVKEKKAQSAQETAKCLLK